MATTTCVDCGKTCPTTTAVKLKALGWRVIVNPSEDDDRNISRWRCAGCWKSFKGATGMPSLPPPPPRRK